MSAAEERPILPSKLTTRSVYTPLAMLKFQCSHHRSASRLTPALSMIPHRLLQMAVSFRQLQLIRLEKKSANARGCGTSSTVSERLPPGLLRLELRLPCLLTRLSRPCPLGKYMSLKKW